MLKEINVFKFNINFRIYFQALDYKF